MTDKFAPVVSLATARSDRAEDASEWRPRDALVKLLGMIDKGEVDTDAMVIVYRERVGGHATSTSFVNATPDVHTAVGIMEIAKFDLMTAE